jgi:hypothetical protein
LQQIKQQGTTQEQAIIKKLELDQKMHHSYSLKTSRSSTIRNRPLFNNKTKEGDLIDLEFKGVPYVFVPGFKNNTFIMPNRVFEKGKAGKRCRYGII